MSASETTLQSGSEIVEKPVDQPPLPSQDDDRPPQRDARFWLVFVALSFCTLLSALDLAGVSTAAPTMVADLHGGDFTWVGAAYTLSSAAFLPLSGNLAQIFGRKHITLFFVLLFAVGSAVAGSARTMPVLIVGRAIQGIGGGGSQSLVYIITADLVPLRHRGLFNGITGMIWTLGSVTGPFITGSLTEKASWRWLFYLNIPLCALTIASVTLFLDLNAPEGNVIQKLANVDWIGNMLIAASSASCMIGLTTGGGSIPWSSPKVLVPLILGFAGLGLSLLYEHKWAKQPTIPKVLYSNRNSLFGYVATFIHGIVVTTVTFYLPTWFQSAREASPIMSGLFFLPMMVSISPAAIAEGIIVSKTGRYRTVTIAGWISAVVGLGLFISLRVSTPIGLLVLFQLLQGLGDGLLYCTTFIVLAPLPLSENASAVSLLTFMRTFPQAWAVSMGGAILQNQLRARLPTSVLADFPDSAGAIVYQVIPAMSGMDAALKEEVKQAFVDSARVIWIVLAAFCGAGLATLVFVKDIPLASVVDKKWGLKERKEEGDAEVAK